MADVWQFWCEAAAAGQRVDLFLAARLGHLSRLRIARLLRTGAGRVNGAPARAGQLLQPGDLVELEVADDTPGAMTPEPLPLAILYEDDELLVLDKPAGLLVHPTRGVKTGTLANALAYHLNRLRMADGEWLNAEPKAYATGANDGETECRGEQSGIRYPSSVIGNPPAWVRPGLVHRLDRATSGLMVVAKTQRALGILTRHFHARLVEKRYRALVRGRVAADELEIHAPIGRVETVQPHWRVSATGRPAHTILRVEARAQTATLVELEPVTGRTNQLRIHCAHAGHAILGDEWYGAQPDEGAAARADQAEPATGRAQAAAQEAAGAQAEATATGATEATTAGRAIVASTRLCLHAARLAFHHPTGGRWLEFTSPLPAEIAAVWAALCAG